MPSLTKREQVLIKAAVANALEAFKDILLTTERSMHHYRIKTENDPRKEGYYDTHRQFKQLEYELDHSIEQHSYDDALVNLGYWRVK